MGFGRYSSTVFRTMSDPLVLILVAILPSVVVFLTSFYAIRYFIGARAKENHAAHMADFRKEDRKQVLPLRLQAYERLSLYLERIQPGTLLLRVQRAGMDSGDLQAALIATIREELEHNVTQQIYVSDRAWAKVRQAKEETIRLVNLSFEQVGPGAPGSALAQRIFETAARLSHSPAQEGLVVLKDEVRRLF